MSAGRPPRPWPGSCASTATGSAPAKNTRALGVFKQGILVLRWFVDGTRSAQLARDNQISVPTAYRYLHEGLTVLADHAPGLSTALERAAAAGCTHLNLDGTVIRTDRVAAPGPNGADLRRSGKHKHHGGNVQAISPRTAGRSGCPRSAPAANTTPPAPAPTASSTR